jgi:hypothetical protein
MEARFTQKRARVHARNTIEPHVDPDARARAEAREHAEMREVRERSEARGRVEARERGGRWMFRGNIKRRA